MDPEHKTFNKDLITTTTTTHFRWLHRRKMQLRRRKLPWVRLGGKRPRRGLSLVRLFRGARLRWLKVKHSFMLKKLKQYYRSVVRDMIDGSASIESIQQRILMESSFAIPVMGFNGFHNVYGIDHRS